MYLLVLSVGNFQAEEQNYVMSAQTEDIEMADVVSDEVSSLRCVRDRRVSPG